MKDMPYIAHESAMVHMERINRRLWILCILLIAILIMTNLAWLVYESQFEDSTTVTQEVESSDSESTIVNGIGNISYGEGKTDGD